MTAVENILKEVAAEYGYTFDVATPTRENIETGAYDKEKVLWYDIQQNGQFVMLNNGGFKLETHLKLHFMDDHSWDTEDEEANSRKNTILREALHIIVKAGSRMEAESNFHISQAPQWQVVYCKFDQNKIDVAVDVYVLEDVVNFC